MSFIEFPSHFEREGSTCRIMRYQFTIAKDDGIRLIGIEDVDAAQVGSQ